MKLIKEEFNSLDNLFIPNFVKNSSFLLTGMTGPFGIWIVRYLFWTIKQNCSKSKIFITTRNIEKAKQFFPELTELHYLKVNVSTEQIEGNFNYIIHAAAPSAAETFAGMKGIEKFNSIIAGANTIIQNCNKYRPRKLIFISSGSVYGNVEGKISENNKIAPMTESSITGLAQGKRAAEYLLNAYCEETNIEFNILRCFSFSGYGIPLDLHYAIGNFVQNAMDNNDIIITGSGKDLRSYLHLGDLAYLTVKILFQETEEVIYNIGGDKQYSIYEIATKVKQVINSKINIYVENKNERIGNEKISSYLPDVTRIKNELKIKPTSLNYSIKTMAKKVY